jgi:polyisoprenyl-phosphate glycosyltransferase
MDADLQHPPELIPEFVRGWEAGNQMVYATRRDRLSESRLRRWAAQAFYALFAQVSTTELPRGGGDFRLLDRRVVDAMNAMPERTRFTKGLYAWLGFKQLAVPYDVPPRAQGRSGWGLYGLWRFAVDGIVSFSTLPLRVWSYVGAAVSCLSIAYALFFFVRTLLFGTNVPGYPSLIIAVMFFSGVQLMSLGIIGEYVGRIFTEVKRRPLYVVATEIGFEPIVPLQPSPEVMAASPQSIASDRPEPHREPEPALAQS